MVILDEQILTEFKQGKLGLLYKRIYPALLLYAIRYMGNQTDFLAEDCVQNAIFNAWKRKEQFDSIYTLKSFLYISIKNEIVSLFRKKKASERYFSQLEKELSFCNSVIEQETQLLVYNAIHDLPAKERRIFEMSYIDGMKNIEIAKKLGVSDSTVKKTKAHALEILRLKLKTNLLMLLIMEARLKRKYKA